MLMLRLRHLNDTFDFVRELTERIKQDRLDRPGLSHESRKALNHLAAPESIDTVPDQLAMITYPGAFRIRPDTVGQGVVSVLSFPS
jgi:hypothetical protein